MINAWMVVNYYLNNSRFDELYMSFFEAAKKLGINLIKRTNSESLGEVIIGGDTKRDLSDVKKPDFVLFWDKDIKLASILEHKGIKVFNSSEAIRLCDDKALTNIALSGSGIRMPKTFVSPLTYFDDGLDGGEFVKNVENELTYPMVIKECMGSFGEQVRLVHNREEFLSTVRKKGRNPFIVQEFIGSSVGRDLRIYVAGGRMKAAIMRYNESDFRANYSVGAGMRAYEPNNKQIAMAEQAAQVLGLDFGGIDILFGENDEPIFCEANSNAHFKKLYTVTGVNMAEEILKSIINKL